MFFFLLGGPQRYGMDQHVPTSSAPDGGMLGPAASASPDFRPGSPINGRPHNGGDFVPGGGGRPFDFPFPPNGDNGENSVLPPGAPLKLPNSPLSLQEFVPQQQQPGSMPVSH